MNPTDEHDNLWHLLGKAKQPNVSPFFSRNVMRDVRSLRQEKPGLFAWFHRGWRWQAPALACSFAVLAIVTYRNDSVGEEDHQLTAIAEDVSSSPDYHVIRDLDELLAWEESSVWLDSNPY